MRLVVGSYGIKRKNEYLVTPITIISINDFLRGWTLSVSVVGVDTFMNRKAGTSKTS